jgi:hypothetical protein
MCVRVSAGRLASSSVVTVQLTSGRCIELGPAGVIVWAPWVSLVTAVVLAPSVREMEYRESYLEGEVLSRAQREYLHRVPVTPKESAAWVGLCALPWHVIVPAVLNMLRQSLLCRVCGDLLPLMFSAATVRSGTELCCRLLSCFWTSFCEPMLLRTAVLPLQVRWHHSIVSRTRRTPLLAQDLTALRLF